MSSGGPRGKFSKIKAGEKQINCSTLKVRQLSSEFKLYRSDMIADGNENVFLFLDGLSRQQGCVVSFLDSCFRRNDKRGCRNDIVACGIPAK